MIAIKTIVSYKKRCFVQIDNKNVFWLELWFNIVYNIL